MADARREMARLPDARWMQPAYGILLLFCLTALGSIAAIIACA